MGADIRNGKFGKCARPVSLELESDDLKDQDASNR